MKNQHTHFWEHFSKEIYGKEVFTSSQENLTLEMDQQSLFETVVKYCEDIRDGQWGVRLYVGDEALLDGSGLGHVEAAKKYFPNKNDASFEKYHKRMTSLCEEYCLIINDPERIDYNLFQWCRSFLTPLFKNHGMNNIGIYNALFIGNYRKTNFGVHFDAESVFQIPVIGQKSMRFWSAEYIRENPELVDSTEYEDHLKNSVHLSSEPGDFTYWPKKAWHIAESDGEFSVAIALSLQEYSDITPYIVNNLLLPQLKNSREIHDQFELDGRPGDDLQVKGIPFDTKNLKETATQVPETVDKIFSKLQALTGSDQAKTLWLKILSSFGFTTPPKLDTSMKFSPKNTYHIDIKYPVLTHLLSDNTRLVASNGHFFQFTESLETQVMINTIATTSTLSGNEILLLSEHLDGETRQAFLDFLCASRALSLASAM